MRPEVEAASDREVQAAFAGTAWTECDSWYRDERGRIVANWPGYMTEYGERLRVLDPERVRVRARAAYTRTRMIDELVSQIEARFDELEGELSDPAVIADRERFTAASRAYRELEPAAKLAAEYRRVADDLEGARELLAEDGDDSELRALLESSRDAAGGRSRTRSGW